MAVCVTVCSAQLTGRWIGGDVQWVAAHAAQWRAAAGDVTNNSQTDRIWLALGRTHARAVLAPRPLAQQRVLAALLSSQTPTRRVLSALLLPLNPPRDTALIRSPVVAPCIAQHALSWAIPQVRIGCAVRALRWTVRTGPSASLDVLRACLVPKPGTRRTCSLKTNPLPHHHLHQQHLWCTTSPFSSTPTRALCSWTFSPSAQLSHTSRFQGSSRCHHHHNTTAAARPGACKVRQYSRAALVDQYSSLRLPATSLRAPVLPLRHVSGPLLHV